MSQQPMTWPQAVGDIVRFSGVTTSAKPTVDDACDAAQALGVTLSELLDAAELRMRYCSATVQ